MSPPIHTSKPNHGCGLTISAVFDYFKLWLERIEQFYEERDRRYEDRFKAQETAVAAALAAQEKLTTAAFAASKEAISKSENSQTAYNQSHNDLLRKMDDQHKETMPRPEAESKFQAQEEKIDEIKTQVAELREFRGLVGGRHTGFAESRAVFALIVGACIGVAEIVIRLLIR